MEGFYNISVDVNDLNSLTDSLKKFTDCEEISDYECEVCKTKKVLTKKTSLRVLPRILVFNLKRIIYDKMTYKRLKVHSKLEFPFELDVRPFTSNSEQQ